jgi:N-acetyl sugar amidotransferase
MMGARVCSYCVMDDTLDDIGFDVEGRCLCCKEAEVLLARDHLLDERGRARLEAMVAQLREQGRGRDYDCMIGLSGGVDSAYLAHVLHQDYGLRLLAVHVDGGWNSEAAVHNIERLVRHTGIDLHTVVIEWAEMRDLQLAFLKSGVINQDIPQDHAFFATLYRTAKTFGIETFLSGVNLSTEGVHQKGGGYPSIDGRHVLAIHRKFGQAPLRHFPIITVPQYLWQTRVRRKPQILRPLNWMRYNKEEAKAVLAAAYGWQDYGVKHAESRFTKFYQETYLTRKTGFDKRRLHLSSLIVAKEITREEAMDQLSCPPVAPRTARQDVKFVAKKLGISVSELDKLIENKIVPHQSYGGANGLLSFFVSARRVLDRMRRAIGI